MSPSLRDIFSYLGRALSPSSITDPNRQGDLPLINSDVTKPNEPYWAHVDTVVEMAYKKGIRIALVPAWGYYIHSSSMSTLTFMISHLLTPLLGNVPDVINATTARSFGTWIGKRYPGLPKLLVADTNSHWTNKSAVSSNYAAGGVQPDYVFTDVSLPSPALEICGAHGNSKLSTPRTNNFLSMAKYTTSSPLA